MATKRLSDRIGIIFLGNVGTLAISLLFRVLLVRLTTRPELGSYNQVWLVYGMISPILLYGVAFSVAYFIPQLSDEERKGFVAQTFLYLLVGSLVFAAGIYLSAPILSNCFHNAELLPLLGIFMWYPILALPISFLSGLFIVLDMSKRAALANILYYVSTPVAVLFPLFLGEDLTKAFVANNLTQFLVLCGGTAYLWWMYRRTKLVWRKDLVRAQFTYAAPIGLSNILSTISRQLGGTVVSLFYPVSQFAVYSVGAFEIPLVRVLSSSMNSVLLPRFVGLYKEARVEEMVRIWHKSIVKLAVLIMPIFVYLFLIAPQFVVLLYTEKYVGSVTLFRIYLCLYPVRVAQYSMLLYVTGDTKTILRGSGLYLILNLVLTLVLVQVFGLAGPALADVLATMAMAVFFLRRVGVLLDLGWRALFPWGTLSRVLGVSMAVGALTYPLVLIPLPNLLTMIVLGIVYLPGYLLIAFKLGVLERSDIELARDWVSLKMLVR